MGVRGETNMKKLLLGLLLGLFLTGCQQPTIDYNSFSDNDPSRPEVELNVSVNDDARTLVDVQKTAAVNETVVLTIKTSDEIDVKVITVITKNEDVLLKDYIEDYTVEVSMYKSKIDSYFDVGMCFVNKEFDNLEDINGKYVFRITTKKNNPDLENRNGWDKYRYNITYTDLQSYKDKKFNFCAIIGEDVWCVNRIDTKFRIEIQ